MSEQPSLPDGIPWPDATRAWWDRIGGAEESKTWTDVQWLTMLDTALCHADVWCGNLDRLSELRIRLNEFGFSPAAVSKLSSGGAPATPAAAASPVDEFTKRRQERKAK